MEDEDRASRNNPIGMVCTAWYKTAVKLCALYPPQWLYGSYLSIFAPSKALIGGSQEFVVSSDGSQLPSLNEASNVRSIVFNMC